jgi:hypothetical protein
LTKQILRAWKASYTRRWHNDYDMSQVEDYNHGHQGRTALLVLQLFPDCSRTLLAWAVVHDQGEAGGVDASAGLKRANPILATALNALEDAEIEKQGFDLPNLTVHEERKLKLCDTLDAWLVMMRYNRHLYARADWQADLKDMMRRAEWLGVGPDVQAVVDEVVTR